MNINRDYLIINDVKKSNVTLGNGSMFFYITDKNTQNIFVNLVINVSKNDLIQKFANIENAEDYTLTMNIVKPDNIYKVVEGKLHDKENAIFEFDLKEDCCDEIGTYKCELLTKCNINDHEEITTSNRLTYKVKSSILNDLDDIVEAPKYPLVIQLFDKLSDIEQYEEDRRANELARQLAEQQRQTRFDTLDADIVNSIQAMDDKVIDVENRITAKEEAVDKLVTDTKADIDEYKVAKDQEIDEYKTAKDTEINNAITNQDSKIDTAITTQNDRITVVENNDVAQDNKLDVLENKDVLHESRLEAIEVKNQQQDNRLDIVENKNAQQDNRLNDIEAKNVEQDNRLDAVEAINVSQNTRLDAIEAKNQQQDDRLLDIEKVNKRQDMNLKCLFAESKNNMIDIAEEGNSIYLQNSTTGYSLIDEIKGNTLVNCNKEPNKELILNGNINTSGDNTVTITEGVDGGLVDVALEGNTLVNVSKTKDSTAITKAYTVENSGNHIALQDDVDSGCRPVITGNTLVNLVKMTGTYSNISGGSVINSIVPISYNLKANTKYTRIFHVSKCILGTNSVIRMFDSINTIDGTYVQYPWHKEISNSQITNIGYYVNTFTTSNSITSTSYKINPDATAFNGSTGAELEIDEFILLEGDYTDKPIPDYFEGLQSTFEDNLVTQEMVDNGEEVADNLGKYRVDYKVTGKNKLNPTNSKVEGYLTDIGGTTQGRFTQYTGADSVSYIYPCLPNTTYTVSHTGNTNTIAEFDKYPINGDAGNIIYSRTLTTSSTTKWLVIYVNSAWTDDDLHAQLEYGDTATSYEPYKESTKTLYLNSPLLEGDTIEEKDNGIYHVHRSELVAYTEGDEVSLITDKVNTLHRLEAPTYELIEQSNLVIPSYANGHLDFDTAVPIEKVEFKPFSEELTYLYPATSYTVQFISTRAILADLILGGASLLSQSIVKGLNRISITTPSELVDNRLIINGNDTGANIMEVIVTDVDRELIYFEAMKSVGECEELQVISINSDKHLSNTQQLTHEPLRAVGDAKDRYVLLDGKWYIERKCGIRAYQEGDQVNYKTDLVNTVYPLEMPAYEEIDYNPMEVYSGTTRITTNSTIPCNITVKNHGYNCLLKPSTTYTISSNLGLNTVTTPSTLTEDCLRFMDTNTSDVTTMKDVLVLEGDWTTKADLIPSNFSGIESAFEQEYDVEKGKYKVNVKIANEDKTKENNITFYINEPLRGVGDVKDKVYVKDDKVVVERNCGVREYQDGDFGTYPTDKVNTAYPLAEPVYEEVEYNDTKLFIESFKNSTLFYNSNIPVTSKLYYSYSVPIVDTVAQTASISDEQDVMIIDLATQVAVMEMLLM